MNPWAGSLLWALLAGGAGASEPARALQDAFAKVARESKPAVVNIATLRNASPSPDFYFGDPEEWLFKRFGGQKPSAPEPPAPADGIGTGFLIDERGHLVTNDHVISGAEEIQVTLTDARGREETLTGRVVGRDPTLDLAVVRISAGERKFPFLRLADSDKVRVGDWAIAIGSPFTLKQTVTAGIISAVRQSLSIQGRQFLDILQTDAAINRGNSGGPLLNLDGEVLGVNTAIFSPSGAFAGIGFAIPANELKRALDALLTGRSSEKPRLGAEFGSVDETLRRRFGLAQAEGALVESVEAKGPADAAGLLRGDIVLKADGRAVAGPEELAQSLAKLKPGGIFRLLVRRGGRSREIAVTLGSRTAYKGEGGGKSAPGYPWQGALFGPAAGGVRVLTVEKGSRLDGYLRPGDLVRALDGADTPDPAAFEESAKKAALERGVIFDLVRAGRSLYVSVKSAP